MQEIEKAYTYLTGERDVLLLLNLTGSLSLSNQVTYLVRMVVRKNQALVSTWKSLSYAQGELEYLHLQTTSMTQQVADCMSVTLKPILHLFENSLQQVDHFHHPLVVSRGKFGRIKCLKMETLFLCRSDPRGHFVFFLCTSCRVPCNGHTCMQILSSLE